MKIENARIGMAVVDKLTNARMIICGITKSSNYDVIMAYPLGDFLNNYSEYTPEELRRLKDKALQTK